MESSVADVVHAVEYVLTTTRAVRLRLDLHRDVPDELLLRCIDVAEQAPCGGAQPSRRWLVVRDPALKLRLADRYREVLYPALRHEFGWAVPGDDDYVPGSPSGDGQAERVFRSALHLAAHLERVPALVLCTIYGEHDRAGSPGLFDSVIQAAWSFCLAARAHGLGTTYTTAHLGQADDVAELLGIPKGVTQITLIPVAHTTGGEFRPARRPSAHDITFFDHWGIARSPEGATVHLDIDIEAPVDTVDSLLSRAATHFDDGVRTRFTTQPKLYGGSRVGLTAQVRDRRPTSELVALRVALSAVLAEVKAQAEGS